MKKGQIPLEMIIMFVVLIVLAAVLITLILNSLSGEKIKKPEEVIKITDFETKCESYCKDIDSLDYCTYYYPGDDWNNNGIKNEIVSVGKYGWYACENRIYCFLVVPCEDRFGPGIDALKKCKKMLCDAFIQKLGDIKLASENLKDKVGFSEAKCTYDEFKNFLKNKFGADRGEKENWYKTAFDEGECK
ncbi:MAG: hypothetical protein QXT38_02965 [Candidatus Aenigmatarchaeota archaeon]